MESLQPNNSPNKIREYLLMDSIHLVRRMFAYLSIQSYPCCNLLTAFIVNHDGH